MVGLLILLALTTSHLYLWQSGLPQIYHIIAAIALVLQTLVWPKIKWQRFWAFGLAFVVYVFFVDLIIWYKYGDIKTILAPTYYISVSYTHLDVYKRQVPRSVPLMQSWWGKRRCLFLSSFATAAGDAPISARRRPSGRWIVPSASLSTCLLYTSRCV